MASFPGSIEIKRSLFNDYERTLLKYFLVAKESEYLDNLTGHGVSISGGEEVSLLLYIRIAAGITVLRAIMYMCVESDKKKKPWICFFDTRSRLSADELIEEIRHIIYKLISIPATTAHAESMLIREIVRILSGVSIK